MKKTELKQIIRDVIKEIILEKPNTISLKEDISDPKIRGPLRMVKSNIEIVIMGLKRAAKNNETLDTEYINRILPRLVEAAVSLNKIIGKQ